MIDRRLTMLKTVLWGLVGVLAAVTVIRFTRGLGAVTNLSDAAPWGLWIGFDVMAGVALAAGGFVLAATVYIFGLERYRPFVRPAVLTAMLGYAAVAVGLLYDLGLPWRIWHPAVYWQHRSVLFEVAMCVMLYLTVLILEFAPAILEHPLLSARPFQAALRWLRRATIPLVITGIVLSTLHQSSLGSLFLITPYRLQPLWYSPILYLLFFVSAVGLGLATVILESLASARFLGHHPHRRELSGLGAAAAVVLWIYVAIRVGDLALRGELGLAVDGSRSGLLFLLELGVSAVVPATLLLFRRVRSSLNGLGVAATCTVLGMILYRLDVSILSFARPQGYGYFPSWEEFAVSTGIVAAFALVFIFFVEHLRVYDDVSGPPAPRRKSHDPATLHGLLPRNLAAPRRYTGVFVAGATVALLFLPVMGRAPRRAPTTAARVVEGDLRVQGPNQPKALFLVTSSTLPELPAAGVPAPRPTDLLLASARDTAAGKRLVLLIDGNQNANGVLFDHAGHVGRLGGDGSCATCHHLNLPLERASGCFECHRDMYEPTALFDHDRHVQALDGNAGCAQCHPANATVKSEATSTACADCHRAPVAADTVIPPPDDRWAAAVGYRDAMHDLCIKCHQREVAQHPARYPAGLDACRNCHNTELPDSLKRLEPARRTAPVAKTMAARAAVPEPGS